MDGHLSFDDLLMRIHPAASRIQKLSQATPVVFIVFDLLVDEKGKSWSRFRSKDAANNWSALTKSYFMTRLQHPSLRP